MSLRSAVSNKIKLFEKDFLTYNNIYISRSAILHNFDFFTKLSPGGLVIPVLKANAYGHGLQEIATILKDRQFPYLVVDGYFEALRIQEVSRQPVLVMGSINPINFAKMSLKGLALVVHDESVVKALASTGKNIKVHIELETGMGRHGVRLSELDKFLDLLKRYPRLQVEGVMTHLADADNPKNKKHVLLQTKRFDQAVEMVRSRGFDPKYLHIAQSAGSVKVQSKHANALRVGIALYGITPLEPTDKSFKKLSSLRPALTLKSAIGKVITIEVGESVSYGRTFKAKHQMRVGVLPLGYYEGLPRALSNVGLVKYGRQYLPIIGRVCMNHTMIDLTGTKAKVGDEVTVVSADPRDRVSINSISREHGIFNYGLLVGLNQNIRRTIVD